MQKIISKAIKKDNIIIGESAHGAHEFAYIKFVLAKEFLPYISFIAVEWDWSDCFDVNKYVKHEVDELNFKVSRFPEFMWDNDETINFIEYLREYNENRQDKIGFYGLDIFGITNCLNTLEANLNKCNSRDNEQNISSNCLSYISKFKTKSVNINSDKSLDIYVCSEVIKNYLKMKETEDKWNVREKHMELILRLLRNTFGGKSLILCHNTHAQDTKCIKDNILTLVSMIQSKFVIGMLCYEGSVLTSDIWGGEIIKRKIHIPAEDSYEYIIFNKYTKNIFMLTKKELEKINAMKYRALGAIVPKDDYYYFKGRLDCSFDYIICIRYISEIHHNNN